MLHANDDAVRGRHGMCGVLAVFWRCLYVVFFLREVDCFRGGWLCKMLPLGRA